MSSDNGFWFFFTTKVDGANAQMSKLDAALEKLNRRLADNFHRERFAKINKSID